MKNDKFEMGTGQAHELAMAFGRNNWTNADVKKLSEGENLIQILSVLRGDIELTPVKSYSRLLAPEHIPERYLVMPGEVAPSEFDVSKLKLRPFFKEGEEFISGQEMMSRAKEFNCKFGLVDGKRILAEQKKIPRELQRWWIPLPGTVLCSPDGKLSVGCLRFDSDDGYWEMGGHTLDNSKCCQSYLFRFVYIDKESKSG